MDFTITVDHRVKIKKMEKEDKYLKLTIELKKLKNMRMTVIPIVIYTLGTVPKSLERGVEELKKLEGKIRSFKLQHF